ncbi:MAG: hypothetical protein SXG53_16625 [Pseudomonadota bacterium]|nr:hypothetical protein [Pseudomonadota bacterium]
MRRLYKAHALLFVCAYFGLLGYRALTDPHAFALFDATEPAQVAALVPAPAGADAGDRPAAEEQAENQNIPLVDAIADSSAAAADAARNQERARLGEVALQAARAAEPQERAEAIDQLSAATPETLQALQIVVTSDSAVRNRIRAVNSLGALAQQQGAHDAVMSILNLAMADANASVASRAKEIYRQSMQRSGSEQ